MLCCNVIQFRQEFKKILGLDDGVSVNSLMENWPIWMKRILAYSKLEQTHRPKIKQLLASGVDKGTQMDEGMFLYLPSSPPHAVHTHRHTQRHTYTYFDFGFGQHELCFLGGYLNTSLSLKMDTSLLFRCIWRFLIFGGSS